MEVVDVSNIGRIKNLQLPVGWRMTRKVLGEIGNSYVYYFSPGDEPLLEFCIFHRGRLIPQEPGHAFVVTLSTNPHDLTKEEIGSLADLLGNQANPNLFVLGQAKTRQLNGKTVLSVQGRFPELDRENWTVYIDAGENGCLIQEVVVTAPQAVYMRYQPSIEQCLETVEWQ